MATYFSCEKCARAVSLRRAREEEWVICSHPEIPGAMVIRCPKHITSYTLRLLHRCGVLGGSEYSPAIPDEITHKKRQVRDKFNKYDFESNPKILDEIEGLLER